MQNSEPVTGSVWFRPADGPSGVCAEHLREHAAVPQAGLPDRRPAHVRVRPTGELTLLQVLIRAQFDLLDPVLTRSVSGDQRRPDPVDAAPSQPAAAVSGARRPLSPQGEVVRYQLQLPGYCPLHVSRVLTRTTQDHSLFCVLRHFRGVGPVLEE